MGAEGLPGGHRHRQHTTPGCSTRSAGAASSRRAARSAISQTGRKGVIGALESSDALKALHQGQGLEPVPRHRPRRDADPHPQRPRHVALRRRRREEPDAEGTPRLPGSHRAADESRIQERVFEDTVANRRSGVRGSGVRSIGLETNSRGLRTSELRTSLSRRRRPQLVNPHRLVPADGLEVEEQQQVDDGHRGRDVGVGFQGLAVALDAGVGDDLLVRAS